MIFSLDKIYSCLDHDTAKHLHMLSKEIDLLGSTRELFLRIML